MEENKVEVEKEEGLWEEMEEREVEMEEDNEVEEQVKEKERLGRRWRRRKTMRCRQREEA